MIDSSLALPPVSTELYSISPQACICWPLRCHSNGGSEVIVAVSRNAIYSDCSHVVCVNEERPGLFSTLTKTASGLISHAHLLTNVINDMYTVCSLW